jgi:hypothetical protein
MRLSPNHYTIRSGGYLMSWVVGSSVDGVNWSEIDRQTGNTVNQASFAVSKSGESRFIRLTQTGKNHGGNDNLLIHAFEVFGTLLE